MIIMQNPRVLYSINVITGLGLNAGDPVPPESGGIRRQAATLEQFSA
jgi:hypothetical protein